MYLSPRRTLSARASGCLTRFGWAYVSGAEPMGSGGWLVICRDLPEHRIRTLGPTALVGKTALPSLRTKLFVRSPRAGWPAGLYAKSLRRSGEMAWKPSLLAFRSFSGSRPAVGAGRTPRFCGMLLGGARVAFAHLRGVRLRR